MKRFAAPALFLLGCIPSPLPDLLVDGKTVLHGDKSFSAEERATIEDALDAWCNRTSGRVCVEMSWDREDCAPRTICKTNIEKPDTVADSVYATASARIDPSKANTPEHLRYAIEHELGHLIDMPHTKSGIMCGVELCETPYVWTEENEIECRKLGWCAEH